MISQIGVTLGSFGTAHADNLLMAFIPSETMKTFQFASDEACWKFALPPDGAAGDDPAGSSA